MASRTARLASRIVSWQERHGRHNLPWQQNRDPYKVWLSEIMLQQTQVATVIAYYQRFLARFPSVQDLAAAPIDDVVALWAGLGYYARARNLHACAKAVARDWQGSFPDNALDLQKLPGIGPSTAAAIAAFCFGERAAILDGNVKRVFARHFGIEEDISRSSTVNELWSLARRELPSARDVHRHPDAMARYTQGLMDLGATICLPRNPKCQQCPLTQTCVAYQQQSTDRIPAKHSRVRERQTRDFECFLIRHQAHVLLEKRPDRGVWGGLWCLPEINPLPLGNKMPKPQAMASFSHELTHFRMVLKPWRIVLPDSMPRPDTTLPTQNWVALDALEKHGLPKPIRDLLLAC